LKEKNGTCFSKRKRRSSADGMTKVRGHGDIRSRREGKGELKKFRNCARKSLRRSPGLSRECAEV